MLQEVEVMDRQGKSRTMIRLIAVAGFPVAGPGHGSSGFDIEMFVEMIDLSQWRATSEAHRI